MSGNEARALLPQGPANGGEPDASACRRIKTNPVLRFDVKCRPAENLPVGHSPCQWRSLLAKHQHPESVHRTGEQEFNASCPLIMTACSAAVGTAVFARPAADGRLYRKLLFNSQPATEKIRWRSLFHRLSLFSSG